MHTQSLARFLLAVMDLNESSSSETFLHLSSSSCWCSSDIPLLRFRPIPTDKAPTGRSLYYFFYHPIKLVSLTPVGRALVNLERYIRHAADRISRSSTSTETSSFTCTSTEDHSSVAPRNYLVRYRKPVETISVVWVKFQIISTDELPRHRARYIFIT